MPKSFSGLIERVADSFTSLHKIAQNKAQTKAALELPFLLMKEFWDMHEYYLEDIISGNWRRWLILQPHLEYDCEGYVVQAARWLKAQV